MQNHNRDERDLIEKNQEACLSGHAARTEKQASQRERRLRAFTSGYYWRFKSAQEIIQFLDIEAGNLNPVNAFLFGLFGFSRSEILDQPFAAPAESWPFFHGARPAANQQWNKTVMRQKAILPDNPAALEIVTEGRREEVLLKAGALQRGLTANIDPEVWRVP